MLVLNLVLVVQSEGRYYKERTPKETLSERFRFNEGQTPAMSMSLLAWFDITEESFPYNKV